MCRTGNPQADRFTHPFSKFLILLEFRFSEFLSRVATAVQEIACERLIAWEKLMILATRGCARGQKC